MDDGSPSSWLTMDDGFALLGKAMVPPWDEEALDSTLEWTPATWEDAPCEEHSVWRHQVMRCTRPPPSAKSHPSVPHHFFIHRLTLDAAIARGLNEILVALAQSEQADAAMQSPAEAASNVNGYHSTRDLAQRPAVASTDLPQLLGGAARLAAAAEGKL
eukprot:6747280-Prymnesium_polylepis.1